MVTALTGTGFTTWLLWASSAGGWSLTEAVMGGSCGVGVVSRVGMVSLVGGSTFFLPSHLFRRLVCRSNKISLTCLQCRVGRSQWAEN